MASTTIAVDLAKSVFEVAVSDRPGRTKERHRLTRSHFLEFFVDRPPSTVVLEACSSAHHWGRKIESLGHRVVLLPPHATRAYVPRNKTDRTDAKGLLEAFRNQDIHPVPVKSVAQQSLMALHRLRSSWQAARTARINTVRGLLREFGFVIPAGAHQVLPHAWRLLNDNDDNLPVAVKVALISACAEIQHLEERVDLAEAQLKALAKETPTVGRLLTIPGIGLITATALSAFVGDVRRFPSARHFASYLGLTPRERSSGGTRWLGGVSKRGNVYLRMLLIHGARSLLLACKRCKRLDRLRTWALRVETHRGHNKAAVALANKLARTAWALWMHDTDYKEQPVMAA